MAESSLTTSPLHPLIAEFSSPSLDTQGILDCIGVVFEQAEGHPSRDLPGPEHGLEVLGKMAEELKAKDGASSTIIFHRDQLDFQLKNNLSKII